MNVERVRAGTTTLFLCGNCRRISFDTRRCISPLNSIGHEKNLHYVHFTRLMLTSTTSLLFKLEAVNASVNAP